MKTIRDHLERHGMLPEEYADEVLAAYDARGLELARLRALAAEDNTRVIAAEARLAQHEAVWTDPAMLQANLLRTGALSRMNALHIAGATDYDDIKARLAQAHEALTFYADNKTWHGRVGDKGALLEPLANDDGGLRARKALDPAAPASRASGTEDLDIDAMYERARHCGPMGEDLRQFSDDEVKAIIERYRAQASALAEARRSALEEAAQLVTRHFGKDIETFDLPNKIRALTKVSP